MQGTEASGRRQAQRRWKEAGAAGVRDGTGTCALVPLQSSVSLTLLWALKEMRTPRAKHSNLGSETARPLASFEVFCIGA